MAARNWTGEQRRAMADNVRLWKPWQASTGPRTDSGKLRTSRNAFKGDLRGELRAISKAISDLLKHQRKLLRVRNDDDGAGVATTDTSLSTVVSGGRD